jgi:hypothetical protein
MFFKVAPFEQDIRDIVTGKKNTTLSDLKFPDKRFVSDEAKDFISKLLEKDI